MKLESMTSLASQVLNIILAPDHVSTGPDDQMFYLSRGSTGYELNLQLKWSAGREWALGPGAFTNGFKDLLAPISARITYGEVEHLRQDKAALEEENEELKKELQELRRYKDAWDLQRGVK